jgi:2-aminoethylphosphonate transport system permease protein
MLVWSPRSRALVWGLGAILVAIFFLAPLGVILVASFSKHWNGVLPSGVTIGHYANLVGGEARDSMIASLVTGLVASLLALLSGACAALALRGRLDAASRFLGLLFFIPSAVPSVSVGLGLLVAFSQPPVLLNGTVTIVLVAHLVLISAFTYGNVSAGLARLPADVEQVAESLGATPGYRLRRVTLPLLTPYLIAAFSLSFAMSMGELGATVMVYPPGWVTLTVVLAVTTLMVLFGLSRVPSRASAR